MRSEPPISETSWLLLIYQLPPKPDYVRVKVRRRLRSIGAVAVKNTVYVLPDRDQQLEDFNWLLKEIGSSGGEAYICRARFLEGLSNDSVIGLFRAARQVDYAAAARDLVALLGVMESASASEWTTERLREEVRRLRRTVDEISDVDFFQAEAHMNCQALLTKLDALLTSAERTGQAAEAHQAFGGRTWVTRANIFVDRMASAWLIRRCIDPDARFRFVDFATYRHEIGELRFDMFEGEYTHVGEQCTFEVLLAEFGLTAPGLGRIGEIVHDIDLKASTYGRPETSGVRAILAGIRASQPTDELRLQHGLAFFDALYTQLASEGMSHD